MSVFELAVVIKRMCGIVEIKDKTKVMNMKVRTIPLFCCAHALFLMGRASLCTLLWEIKETGLK